MRQRSEGDGRAPHAADAGSGSGETEGARVSYEETAPGCIAMGQAESGSTPGRAGSGPEGVDMLVVRRVLDGEVDAFGELVRRHGARVGRTVARHIPFDQREEVVQDTWVRAFQSLHGFQLGTRFADWVTGIAVRASYDFWRQYYRRREVTESALGETHREWVEAVGATRSAEIFREQVRRADAHEVLEYALAQVSPEDRMVVSLVHLEGLSAQEAAQQLGWSAVNVKVRAHRTRRKMRQLIEDWLGEEGGR
jgi:RNA polymerase sigma-70 factor, ECF subfamily